MATVITGGVAPLWVPIVSLFVTLLWLAFLGLAAGAMIRYLRSSKRSQ